MSREPPRQPPQPSVSSEVSTRLLIIVIALLVVVLLLNVIPFLLNTFNTTPMVNLSDVNPTIDGCGSGQNPYYTYTFTFTLTNTGNVSANVTVAIIPQDPQFSPSPPVTQKVFTVSRGSQVPGNISFEATQYGCQQPQLNLGVTRTSVVQA